MWQVLRVEKDEWREKYATAAHAAVFQKYLPKDLERISYALLIVKDDTVIGYVTVREHDSETVYWQFGGVFPTFRRSFVAAKLMEEALLWQKDYAKRVTMFVENTNVAMLKLALSFGFLVIGTRTFIGSVYVDLIKEFSDGNNEHLPEHAKPSAGSKASNTDDKNA